MKRLRLPRFRIWHLFAIMSLVAIGSSTYRKASRHQPSDFFVRFNPEEFLRSCTPPQDSIDESWSHYINALNSPRVKFDQKNALFRVTEIELVEGGDFMWNAKIAIQAKLKESFESSNRSLNVSEVGAVSGEADGDAKLLFFAVDYDLETFRGTIMFERTRISSAESYVYIQISEWKY
jgi:hypothetical protein